MRDDDDLSDAELAKMDPGVATHWQSGNPEPIEVLVLMARSVSTATEARLAHLEFAGTGQVRSGRVDRDTLAELVSFPEVIEVNDGRTTLTP